MNNFLPDGEGMYLEPVEYLNEEEDIIAVVGVLSFIQEQWQLL